MIYAQGYTTHQGLKMVNPVNPSNVITLNPPSSITSYTLTLPSAVGTNGQVLTTDASGNLSWTTVGGSSGWSLTGNSGTTASNFIGTTDAQPLLIRSNNTQVASFATDGSLRIGYTAASLNTIYTSTAMRLFMEGSDETYMVASGATNTAVAGPHFEIIRARGSSGSYSDVQMNDEIGQYRWRGYYGTSYNSVADIAAEVDSTPSSGNVPGRLIFSTTPVGGGTNFLPRMTIKSSGDIGIATQNPSSGSKLDVGGTVALSNSNNSASELRLYEPSSSGTNYSGFKAAAQSADISYTLPTSAPTTNQYLESDASGNMSWKYSTKFVQKTSNESISSSTALQDDNELQFTIGTNETWELIADLDVSGAAGSIKVAIIIPSGTLHVYTFQEGNGTEQGEWLTTSGTANTNSIAVVDGKTIVNFKGLIVSGGSGGSVKIQWAQQSSSGTATTVKANSYLSAKRWQ